MLRPISSNHQLQPPQALLKAARLAIRASHPLGSSRPVPRPADLGAAERHEMIWLHWQVGGQKGENGQCVAPTPHDVNENWCCQFSPIPPEEPLQGDQTKVRPISPPRYGAGRIPQGQSALVLPSTDGTQIELTGRFEDGTASKPFFFQGNLTVMHNGPNFFGLGCQRRHPAGDGRVCFGGSA